MYQEGSFEMHKTAKSTSDININYCKSHNYFSNDNHRN